jgi:hypothetical protein
VISALFSFSNDLLKPILFPMFHTFFRNSQMQGTRKPHQLSYLLPAWKREKSLQKFESAKENHSLLPLPAQKRRDTSVSYFFLK